ncbi:lysophospholipid acyltransferase family protein [Actinophytocola sp.]|uniref:lysophospholipid acyltransferase family protein n=1 Tax=Actinophytocola sp. TaxID=1872138 RepID=UPI002D80443B|nr:lysophospholipid acyltransferase family protein [Actinophytocola sp.]HET9141988.1 lysophospholipid acyltransferase family protein [Actinophytocola sp.]HEU5109983.1 lysophospholipid acyltransferase family protein [Micromonosporaceae bacterium]
MPTPPALPDGAKPWLHDLGRWVATWLHRPAFRIRFHGRERIPPTGPVVLVANHSSLVEPQVIFGMVDRRAVFLVKEELARGPAGRWLRWIGQLSIRRGEPDREPLLAAVRFLRAGGLVGVFPEGTRGGGDVLRAEQGAAWLVRSSGAVVLPVACRGTLRPQGSGRRFRPRVDVLVGAPFTVSVQRGRTGLTVATEEIRVRLADLVGELDRLREQDKAA